MRVKSVLSLLLVAGTSPGCSNSKTTPEQGAEVSLQPSPLAKAAKQLEIEASALHLHLPFLDEDDIVRGLQGAWVFDSKIRTIPSAWDIQGREFAWLSPAPDQAPRVKTAVGTLRVLAPCKIAQVHDAGLTTVTNVRNVVVTDAGVFEGAAMGQRRGADYVVCTSLGIFSGTSDACFLWTEHKVDSLARMNATCHFVIGDDGAEYFHAQVGDEIVRIPVFGDIISTWPLDESRARRVDGRAEATAAIGAE